MPKRYLIPVALILMFLLAACSGGQPAEVSQAEAASMPETAEENQDETMMEESSDEAMMEESSDETMMEEGSDEAMMEESSDEAMMEEGSDETMMEEGSDEMAMADEGHDADEAMMEEGSDETMMDDGMMEEEPNDDMAGAMLPAWQTIALTNAATGEAFTLGDFQGKTVFVEPMATWCSNCRAQQGHVREAKAQLGEDVVFIGLSLETNLPPEQLASYAQGNGFDWTYAVMPVELLAGLTDEFGRSITSAPSTPHFIIRPDGSFTELATGIHPAEAIVAEIQAEQG